MEVWGRNFGKIEGGRAPAEDATYFSVFLRVPDMVVKPLLQLYVLGFTLTLAKTRAQMTHTGSSG
jgi:hypothetical protein